MADVVDKATRSRMMSGIKGKNTQPELKVRKYLHGRGLRYKLHANELPGKPDLVLPKFKAVIFVHGCFWHQHVGCKYAAQPQTRAEFWNLKLSENVKRDSYQVAALEEMGWRVFVIWECELQGDTSKLNSLFLNIIQRKGKESQ